MSTKLHNSKATRLVKRVAEDYGVELEIRQGGKHLKVYLDDVCISILPNGNGSNSGRNMLNTMQHIRRAIEVKLYGRPTADEGPARHSR